MHHFNNFCWLYSLFVSSRHAVLFVSYLLASSYLKSFSFGLLDSHAGEAPRRGFDGSSEVEMECEKGKENEPREAFSTM